MSSDGIAPGTAEAGQAFLARSFQWLTIRNREAASLLPEHGNPVDRQRRQFESSKAIRQQLHQGLAALVAKPAGQRHVKTKIVHHIGISPAIEMRALDRRQLRWVAPRTISASERRAERVEFADAIGRQLDQFRRRLRRDHGDEAADRTDDRPSWESPGALRRTRRRRQEARPRSCLMPATAAPSAWRESRICGDRCVRSRQSGTACSMPSAKGRSSPLKAS